MLAMGANVMILAWKFAHMAAAGALFGCVLGLMVRAGSNDFCRGLRWAATCDFVLADRLTAALALLLQPAAAVGLANAEGVPFDTPWLLVAFCFQAVCMACWIPAVGLQLRLFGMATLAMGERVALPPPYWRCLGAYFAFGSPAVIAALAGAAMMAFGLEF